MSKKVRQILFWAVIVLIVFMLLPRSVQSGNPFISRNGRAAIVAEGAYTPGDYAAFYAVDSNVIFLADACITGDGYVILAPGGRLAGLDGPIESFSYNGLVSAGFSFMTFHELAENYPDNRIIVRTAQEGESGDYCLNILVQLIASLDGEFNTFSRVAIYGENAESLKKLESARNGQYPELQLAVGPDTLRMLYVTHWIGLDFAFHSLYTAALLPASGSGSPLDKNYYTLALARHGICPVFFAEKGNALTLIKKGAGAIVTDDPAGMKVIFDGYYGPDLQ